MTGRRPTKPGLTTPELARKIRPGAVFAVKDLAVEFPEARVPGAGARDLHPTRRCIVV